MSTPSESTFVEQPAVSLTDDLSTESLPSLSDFADEVGGPLPRGWYSATIMEGYATRSGKQFLTGDEPSKDGASRNLKVCVQVPTGRNDEVRNLQANFNYRTTDFTPDRLAFIKAKRDEMQGVKGRWPDSDAQRSSLAIAFLGQLEKAIGKPFTRSANGGIVASVLVGAKVDIRLNINEDSFNDITAFAKFGTVTAGPKRSSSKQ